MSVRDGRTRQPICTRGRARKGLIRISRLCLSFMPGHLAIILLMLKSQFNEIRTSDPVCSDAACRKLLCGENEKSA